MLNFTIFLLSLGLVTKSASMALRYCSRIAVSMNISRHLAGFIIVAIISVLPETFISIVSALENEPTFGLGTLFGSNVADLTIIFAIVIFVANRGIKIQSKVIKNSGTYLLAMSIPIILGLNGFYSRYEGVILILTGILFYHRLIKDDQAVYYGAKYEFEIKNVLYLIFSMAALLVGSHLIVEHGLELAHTFKISPALIGMFVVSFGTTLPELFFSIKAMKNNNDELAMGDILGTVLTDAIIVVGIIALISPFAFPAKIIYVTGVFMLAASALLFHLMKTDRVVSKKEGLLLIVFYLTFLATELFVGR